MKPLPQLLRTSSLLIPRRHLKIRLFNPERNWKQKIIYQFWRPVRNKETGKINYFNLHYNIYLYLMSSYVLYIYVIRPKLEEDPDYKPIFNFAQNPIEKMEEFRKMQAEKNNQVFKESKLANYMREKMAEHRKDIEEEKNKNGDAPKKEAEVQK